METKVILLTGGSTGIGFETAVRLMNKGCRVYSASRSGTSQFKGENGEGEIIPIQMDVNNAGEINDAVALIMKENNRLDAVICNAGNGVAGSVEDTSEEEMKYQFETNFFGVVKTIQACLPVFRRQGYGRIMTTSSVAGIVPLPYQAFYSAGKSAVLNFMQALSMEVKPFGIECCTVLPGDTKTKFTSTRRYTERSKLSTSAYKDRMDKTVKRIEESEQNGMEAAFVAQKMVKELLKSRCMKQIIIPGTNYRIICKLFNMCPVSFRSRVIERIY